VRPLFPIRLHLQIMLYIFNILAIFDGNKQHFEDKEANRISPTSPNIESIWGKY